ncbi:hypothetical protein BDV96DRAFT_595581 [Lophiotrema nucula]|uniref:Secreted protein n=1 Tax=Lophiotrema nucula TaxID=690887 RepID=A0A6A5ZL20_9PLEO|nr:hypothetical protein BDV96DRAFT_595581 [Lophiotrema nucula]
MQIKALLLFLAATIGVQQVAATAKNPRDACFKQFYKEFGSHCKWKDPDGTKHKGHCTDGYCMTCVEDDEWYSVYDPDHDYNKRALNGTEEKQPVTIGANAREACISWDGANEAFGTECAYFEGDYMVPGYCNADMNDLGKICLPAATWHFYYDPQHRFHRSAVATEEVDAATLEKRGETGLAQC